MTTHTIETINSCRKRILITINAKTVNKATQQKILNQAQQLKHGGFRANASVTQQLIKQQMTPQVEAEIRSTLYSNSFSEVCKKEKLQYEGTPSIQDFKTNEDGSLSYTVTIDVYPDISHVNWQGVKLNRLDTEITDARLSDARPLFQKLGLEKLMEEKSAATHWCEWIVEVFQHQHLLDQVIQALPEQNVLKELPEGVVNERYEALKKDQNGNMLSDEDLKEKARKFITADILFKAYAKEHNITVARETLIKRIEQAQQNPFIMSHIKDPSRLDYHLTLRIFEEAVINHLANHADCTSTALPLPEFMSLAFNLSQDNAEQVSTTSIDKEVEVK